MRASPTGSDTRLEFRAGATPMTVAAVRRAVATFAARHGIVDADVALAVSEAVTNVVLHAYRDGRAGDVRVVACRYPNELVVVVRDYGCGMRPNPRSPGAGLGLSIIGAAASEMNIERPDDGGTRLRLRFHRPARAAA